MKMIMRKHAFWNKAGTWSQVETFYPEIAVEWDILNVEVPDGHTVHVWWFQSDARGVYVDVDVDSGDDNAHVEHWLRRSPSGWEHVQCPEGCPKRKERNGNIRKL